MGWTPGIVQNPLVAPDSVPCSYPLQRTRAISARWLAADLAGVVGKPSYSAIFVWSRSVTLLLQGNAPLAYFSDAASCDEMEEGRPAAPDLDRQAIPYFRVFGFPRSQWGRKGRPKPSALSIVWAISSFGELGGLSFLLLWGDTLVLFSFHQQTMKNDTWDDDIDQDVFSIPSPCLLGKNALTSTDILINISN